MFKLVKGIVLGSGVFLSLSAFADVTCVQHCTRRDWNGNCIAWGPDVCGEDPSTTPHCTRRDWNGNCIGWGEDVVDPGRPGGHHGGGHHGGGHHGGGHHGGGHHGGGRHGGNNGGNGGSSGSGGSDGSSGNSGSSSGSSGSDDDDDVCWGCGSNDGWDPAPAPSRPSTGRASTVVTLSPTYFKASRAQASSLASSQKCYIPAGTRIGVMWYVEEFENKTLKAQLGSVALEKLGCSFGKNGSIGYFYLPAVSY